MHKSKAEVIAAALARLPQRVIWRYDGEMPDSLGANTKTMDWIPQNELMGHAKTKLFISHGGKTLSLFRVSKLLFFQLLIRLNISQF